MYSQFKCCLIMLSCELFILKYTKKTYFFYTIIYNIVIYRSYGEGAYVAIYSRGDADY